MNTTILQKENIELKAMLSAQTEKMKIILMNNTFLEERVRLLEHKLFGKSSESKKSQKLIEQDSLFNEAEVDAPAVAEPIEKKTKVEAHERAVTKGGRKALSEDLQRVEKVIEIPVEELTCPHDGAELKRIGEEVSEKLETQPARIYVERTIRPKYACPCCQSYMMTAKAPAVPFPKGLATAGTAAYVITSKYADGLPLHRQEKMFERLGIELGRGTLARWMIESADLLKPIYDSIREHLVSLPVVHCDETTLQVLKEKGRAAETNSYMWVLCSSKEEKVNGVYFEYHATRSGKAAEHLLDGFAGTIVCEGFDGYQTYASRNSNVTRAGCWAHVRRKFFDAAKASAKGAGVTQEMLALVDELFALERQIENLSYEEKLKKRIEISKPKLEEIKRKADSYLMTTPPKSELGKALGYMLNEWKYLQVFLFNGKVSIHNNRVENAIRPFAIGRKNWLFACSTNGAHASATLYSLIESAKLNSLNTYDYIKYLLDTLPALGQAPLPHEISPLLPWNRKAQKLDDH